MNAWVDALNHAASNWWPHVLHATWQSSLVAGLFLLIVWAGRRWPAQIRYGLVVIALVKFTIPPTLSLPTGLFSRLGPTVVVSIEAADESAGEAAARDAGALAALGQVRWRAWLMLAHAAGALAAAAWIALHCARVARMARRARAVTTGPPYELLGRLSQRLGLRRRVRLLVTDEPVAPMAFGAFRPGVLVPASVFREAPCEQLETVLAHELAHHRRGDLWVNWVQAILAVAWWFNPVFWLLNRAIRRAREDCCDDLLLSRKLTTDGAYCQALLNVAAQMRRSLLLAAVARFAEQVHPLGERIKRIMDPRLHRPVRLSLAAVGTMVLLAGLVLPGLRTEHLASPGYLPAVLPAADGAPAGGDLAAAAPAAGQGAGSPVRYSPEHVWPVSRSPALGRLYHPAVARVAAGARGRATSNARESRGPSPARSGAAPAEQWLTLVARQAPASARADGRLLDVYRHAAAPTPQALFLKLDATTPAQRMADALAMPTFRLPTEPMPLDELRRGGEPGEQRSPEQPNSDTAVVVAPRQSKFRQAPVPQVEPEHGTEQPGEPVRIRVYEPISPSSNGETWVAYNNNDVDYHGWDAYELYLYGDGSWDVDGLADYPSGGAMVPEPATIAVLGMGGLVVLLRRRRG
jgi:beta-lactamase regulating signal transducer with metallopeptidase domain